MSERTTEFGPLTIAYDGEVLEPRPWTLAQSQWAIELSSSLPAGPVLELCAGVGHIGLVVAHETGRPIVQVDTEPRACALARRNAATAGVAADVRCTDLEQAVGEHERFPLVLADPPYVPADRVDSLPEDPDDAIDGGPDGLDVVRRCLRVAARHLDGHGRVVLQVGGAGQSAVVGHEAGSYGLEAIETQLHGEDRALVLLRVQPFG